MIFVGIADSFDNLACLLSHIRGLLARGALQGVRICVQGHHIVLDVLFDEAERLSRGSVITVYERFDPVDGSQLGVLVAADDILPNVLQKFDLVGRERLLTLLLFSCRAYVCILNCQFVGDCVDDD